MSGDDWTPIASAPRDRTLVEVLVPTVEGGLIEGRAYFDPAAYDGTWWWEGTSREAYIDSSIEDGNHGPPLFWRSPAPTTDAEEWLARRFYTESPAHGSGYISWDEAQTIAEPYVSDLRRFARLAIGLLHSGRAA